MDGNDIHNNGFSGLGVTGGSEAELWSGNNIYNNNDPELNDFNYFEGIRTMLEVGGFIVFHKPNN